MANYFKATEHKAFSYFTDSRNGISGPTKELKNYMIHSYILHVLILGTPNIYYVNNTEKEEKKETVALDNIKKMIDNGLSEKVMDIIIDVYENNRAPKLDPTFMILAYLARSDDLIIRRRAFELIKKLRTLSHVYSFMSYYKSSNNKSTGWGRLPKREISNLICKWTPKQLAYQAFKYKSSRGWTLRDILRCCHLNPKIRNLSKGMQLVIQIIVDQNFDALNFSGIKDIELIKYLTAIRYIKEMGKEHEDYIPMIIHCIKNYNLPEEIIPSWSLKYAKIWKALLFSNYVDKFIMSMTDLIKNLNMMTMCGLFDNNNITDMVCQRLTNTEVLKESRIHPVKIMMAYTQYKQELRYNKKICDALYQAFYLSFDNIKPTNKRICHAFDGSGSMTCQFIPYMSHAQAVTILGMIYARTENPGTQTYCMFSSNSKLHYFNLTKNMKLDESMRATILNDWGSVNCSLPIEEAIIKFKKAYNRLTAEQRNMFNDLKYKRKDLTHFYKKIGYDGIYDAFVIYTDNDVSFNGRHPSQALIEYRNLTGIQAHMVVVATEASDVTIADPNDPLMLDIVGFDSNMSKIMNEFICGNI